MITKIYYQGDKIKEDEMEKHYPWEKREIRIKYIRKTWREETTWH